MAAIPAQAADWMIRDLTQSCGSHAISAPRAADMSAAPENQAGGFCFAASNVIRRSHRRRALNERDDLRGFTCFSQQVCDQPNECRGTAFREN